MIPLFKSHYSIGKSVLTLKDPSKTQDDGPDSIFKIALANNLDKIVLVEDSLIGFFEAYKMAQSLNIDLIFGLRLSMRNSKEEQDSESEHKIIIFAKNSNGCKLLNKIYSEAFTSFEGFLDYKSLKKFWNNKDLKLAVPFYDSFLHVNNFSFGNAVPDFSFSDPCFFVESNGLAFDHLLKNQVDNFISKNPKHQIQKVKSIYYKNKKDVESLMAYKIICGRNFQKNRSLSRPELSHFNSDQFCFESWKEYNATVR